MKRLVFFTLSRSVCRVFQEQLASFFRDRVAIQGYCMEDPLPSEGIKGDLFLASSRDVLPALSRVLEGCRPIVSRRGLDPSKIGPLFRYPPGTRFLVVNNAEDVALETVELLRSLGLHSYELVPWWLGCPVPSDAREVVVTPGFTSLVTFPARHVYDLGVRPIDISTLVEITMLLGLPLDGIHHATVSGYQGVVNVVREQASLIAAVELARRDLEAILDNVRDAVIMSDYKGKVHRLNNAAKNLLGVHNDTAKALNLGRWFPRDLIAGPVDRGVAEVNQLCSVGGKKCLVTVVPIASDEPRLIITARESRSIEQARGELVRAMRSGNRTARYRFEDIIGASAPLMKTVNMARKIAETNTTVFITGETGTGKELFAQAIHNASPRRSGPFIAQNIAALPEQLIQSELFGYESGAFTGARREGKPGLFEAADGGTIFLDEIADISPAVQISLLRVLQEREVTRVGGSGLIPVSVRVIAATNRDLSDAVSQGRFRKDLFYRLCAYPLRIPPLRERPGDIPLLIRHFIRKHSKWTADPPVSLTQRLQSWSWPGNVREIEELVRHSASVSDTEREFFSNMEDFFDSSTEIASVGQALSVADIRSRLRCKGELAQFGAILSCLASERSEAGMGRDSLQAALSSRGLVPMTVAQIRARLRTLSELGLTESARGRNGTRLTSLGKAFLAHSPEMGLSGYK
ncbi:MAG: sigma-54 interaction domain-containing protein [Ignavibacteriales bacterium]